jgi:ferritin-like metal-binding protein YciE
MESLKDLFEHQLKDLYSAEKQLIDALPDMAEKATHPELKKAFREHLEETKEHKKRLEEVCNELGVDPSGETCKAMQGLIKEGKDMMKEKASDEVMDAGLIADAQRVEHYEIAGYGTVCSFAESLGHSDIKEKLGKTLEEEKEADEKLLKLSQSVNEAANV